MVTAREGAGSVMTFPVSLRKAARQRAAEMPRSLLPQAMISGAGTGNVHQASRPRR
jgi:hypothetical protein